MTRWNSEEIDFLKRSYGKYPIKEIAIALDRNTRSVSLKCKSLLLGEAVIKPTEINPNNKVCGKCKRELPKSEFYKNHKSKDGLNNWCNQCKHENYLKRKQNRQIANSRFMKEKEVAKKIREETAKVAKRCTKCGKVKSGEEFYFKNSAFRRDSVCIECSRQESKEGRIKRIINGVEW